MKLKLFVALFVALLAAHSHSQSSPVREKKIEERELPGYKLSPTNSIILEQSIRRSFKKVSDKEVEKVEIHLKCEKKWKIRGRDKSKAYQCDPIFLKVIN
jgi:hypothetical protein